MVRQALGAGARAYVVKSAMSTDLVSALRALQANKDSESPIVFGSAQNNLDVQEVLQRSAAFEKELRDTTERWRLAQEVAHVGTFEWNIQSGSVKWTKELERIYGLVPGTFAGMQAAWERLIHPQDRDEILRKTAESLKSGHFEGEWRIIWPDGSVRWILGRGSVVQDEARKPRRMVGVNIDITDRKRAEEQLALHAERQGAMFRFVEALNRANSFADTYAAALDGIFSGLKCSRAAILLYDQLGAIQSVSWRGVSKAVRVEAQSHSLWQADAGSSKPMYVERLATSAVRDSTKALLQKEGIEAFSIIPISSRGKLIGKFIVCYDEPHAFNAQEVEFSHGIAHELALGIHRRAAEEALAEKASLLDLSSDAILVRDPEDRIVYWNSAATEMYGYTREQAIGRVTHDILATQFPEPLDEIKKKLRADGRWSGQLLHKRGDGSQVAVSSRWCLAIDEKGNLKSILETNRDVTAELALGKVTRKLAEREIAPQVTNLVKTRPKSRAAAAAIASQK